MTPPCIAPPRIAMVLGDPAGIGPEITARLLAEAANRTADRLKDAAGDVTRDIKAKVVDRVLSGEVAAHRREEQAPSDQPGVAGDAGRPGEQGEADRDEAQHGGVQRGQGAHALTRVAR